MPSADQDNPQVIPAWITSKAAFSSCIALLTLAVFALDVVFPLGVAAYIPYVIVVILASWLSHPRAIYFTAGACTVLTILGFLGSTPGGVGWKVVTNRLLTIGIIWITATLVLQRKRLVKALQTERDTFEQRVEQRTAQLQAANAQLQREVAVRQCAEEALQRQRDWFDVTLSSIGDAVLATDLNGIVTFLNPVAEDLTGWEAEAAIGAPIDEVFRIMDAPSHTPLTSPVSTVLQHRQVVQLSSPVLLIQRQGNQIEIADSAAPILNRQGALQGAVLVFRDVTESRHLEAALRHAQKMQAVGTLAGGIAHEFNNILAGILGFAELTLQRVDPNSDIGSSIQSIHRSGLRAKRLVQQILAFSHPSSAEPTLVSMDELVQEALGLVRTSLPATIALETTIASGVGAVRVDPPQLHQVILNLCANAIDAMQHQGGQLRVHVDTLHLDTNVATLTNHLQPGPYLQLSIEDNGPGIDPEMQPKIFEPFFTTKGVGEGTGMGLAIVHGIVTRHGGGITVNSILGEGTTIAVYLPHYSEPLPALTSSHEPTLTGTGRILFIDDEETIVVIAQQVLTQLGYQTYATTSCHEALEAFRIAPDSFDLVVTDLTMPNMTGTALMQELRQTRADIPVIVCTGYSRDDNVAHIRALGANAVLQKSFSGAELSSAIQRVLS